MGEADYLAALMAMPGQWVDQIRRGRPLDKLILDIDSSVKRQMLTRLSRRLAFNSNA